MSIAANSRNTPLAKAQMEGILFLRRDELKKMQDMEDLAENANFFGNRLGFMGRKRRDVVGQIPNHGFFLLTLSLPLRQPGIFNSPRFLLLEALKRRAKYSCSLKGFQFAAFPYIN